MVGLERLVGREHGCGDDLAQEEVRTEPGVDEHGVLPDPTEAGALGVVAFHYGAIIDVGSNL